LISLLTAFDDGANSWNSSAAQSVRLRRRYGSGYVILILMLAI
jgi:hypothetical protein